MSGSKTPAVLLILLSPQQNEIPVKLLPAITSFMTHIDCQAFLSVYCNYYRLTLSLLHQHHTPLHIITYLSSKQICTLLHNQL